MCLEKELGRYHKPLQKVLTDLYVTEPSNSNISFTAFFFKKFYNRIKVNINKL